MDLEEDNGVSGGGGGHPGGLHRLQHEGARSRLADAGAAPVDLGRRGRDVRPQDVEDAHLRDQEGGDRPRLED